MGMREYGTAFHGVIHDFARRPGAGAEACFALLRDAFADALRDAGFRAFQWPRVESWARGFLAWEAGRREGVAHVAVEERGRLEIPLHDGSIFTLSANADRIEVDQAGLATVVDFKTGAAPTIREVKAGFAPQLTLEADMVARGAFAGLGPVARVAAAAYVKFGADDVAKVIDLDWKGDPPFADVVAEHREELIGLLNSFRSAETGYLARPFPQIRLPLRHLRPPGPRQGMVCDRGRRGSGRDRLTARRGCRAPGRFDRAARRAQACHLVPALGMR